MIFNPKSYVNLILVSLTRTGGKKQSSRFSRTWGALMESAVHILSAGGCTHGERCAYLERGTLSSLRGAFPECSGENIESAGEFCERTWGAIRERGE